MRDLLKEELRKRVLLEELSLLIEKEIGVGPVLKKKLDNINKPFADKLSQFLQSNQISDEANIDMIEYSDDDNKTITAYTKDSEGKTKGRKYKVGKLLQYLGVNLGEFKGYELEELIAHLKKGTTDDFKIVDGDKILWAYHCDNYDEGETMGSCMRYEAAQAYLGIYTENPDQVKCLVLLNPNNGKVRGRALLWKTDSGEIFMDRVYMTNNQYKNLFLQYAEQNDYVTSTDDEVTLDVSEFEEYPYMDTFQYLNKDQGVLKTDNDYDESTIFLDDTSGGSRTPGVRIEYGSHEGESIPEDDAVYLSYKTPDEYIEGYAHEDDVFVVDGEVFLQEHGVELYDGTWMYRYSDNDIVVEITRGPYQGDYALMDDTYQLYPDHYGDEYVLQRTAGGNVVTLYDDKYDYYYAMADDAVELFNDYYDGAYAMEDDAVRLYPERYGEDAYALDDHASKITLKDGTETWVMDNDLDDFEDIRAESRKFKLGSIFETVVKEARYDGSNISQDIGLFLIGKNSIVLYDMLEYDDSDRARGIKGIITLSNEGNNFSVNKVAANKGYGPLMYELAMQHVYPKAIVSDRDGDTREGAINVLNKFVNGVSKGVDVKTKQPGDNGYIECLEFGCDDDMPEFMRVYNSEFRMTDTSLYNKLKAEADEFLDDVGHEFLDELEDYAIDFFDKRY